jgi:hypothetical protein
MSDCHFFSRAHTHGTGAVSSSRPHQHNRQCNCTRPPLPWLFVAASQGAATAPAPAKPEPTAQAQQLPRTSTRPQGSGGLSSAVGRAAPPGLAPALVQAAVPLAAAGQPPLPGLKPVPGGGVASGGPSMAGLPAGVGAGAPGPARPAGAGAGKGWGAGPAAQHLPEGFFTDRVEDARARGVKLPDAADIEAEFQVGGMAGPVSAEGGTSGGCA